MNCVRWLCTDGPLSKLMASSSTSGYQCAFSCHQLSKQSTIKSDVSWDCPKKIVKWFPKTSRMPKGTRMAWMWVSWSSAFFGSRVRSLPPRARLPILTFALLSMEIRKEFCRWSDVWFACWTCAKIASVSGIFLIGFVFCVFLNRYPSLFKTFPIVCRLGRSCAAYPFSCIRAFRTARALMRA